MTKRKSKQLAEFIAECIDDKKGYDIYIHDVSKLTDLSNYFVVATVDSDIQMRAIANYIESELKDRGVKLSHKEGFKAMEWVILDYFDVIVHLFLPEKRLYYQLEKMWSDAKSIRYSHEANT
ncbi:MAG: ribosome silencing factor [Calditrichaeota bacterium]|nr:ribosome silencing factor [Calditrichota bacterium]